MCVCVCDATRGALFTCVHSIYIPLSARLAAHTHTASTHQLSVFSIIKVQNRRYMVSVLFGLLNGAHLRPRRKTRFKKTERSSKFIANKAFATPYLDTYNLYSHYRIDAIVPHLCSAENQPPKSINMDPLTMAWYALTVMLLAIFVGIIILTKSRCGTRPPPRSADEPTAKPPATRQQAPMTPAPAYSEFAPPSYDDAVTRNLRQATAGTTILTPAVFVITINEKSPPSVMTSLSVVQSSCVPVAEVQTTSVTSVDGRA